MRFTGEWEGGIIFPHASPTKNIHPDQVFLYLNTRNIRKRFLGIHLLFIDMDILYLYSSNRQEVREEKAVWEK